VSQSRAAYRVDRQRWEREYLRQLQLAELPAPEKQYHFHPVRKWRSDFAYPGLHLLIEIEGGIYTNGRHVRPQGYQEDCIKYNEAALLGYRLLRFTPDMVESGSALRYTEAAIQSGGSAVDDLQEMEY